MDGPLPAHYEPHESPFENSLYEQRSNPARQQFAHFAGGVKLALLAGNFDPLAEDRAGVAKAVHADQQLCAAEE